MDSINIDTLDLHDSSLESMRIDFDESIINLTLSHYQENELVQLTISCYKVNKLNISNVLIENFSNVEIYSFNYHKAEKLLKFDIVLLLGIGKPSVDIKFECESVTVYPSAHARL